MTTQVGLKNVELTDEGISIEWDDGHTSFYASKYLRLNCGCAQCVEEWTQRKLLDPAMVPADIRAEDYLMVGRYAIQFLWSDTHYTGIYPFEMLRRICPCEECTLTRKERKQE